MSGAVAHAASIAEMAASRCSARAWVSVAVTRARTRSVTSSIAVSWSAYMPAHRFSSAGEAATKPCS